MERLPTLARRAGAVLLCVLLVGVVGCGASRGDVQGAVTHRGKPVVWGTVVVIGSDHMPYYGVIQLDGTFLVRNVPLGPAQIGVSSPDPNLEPRFDKPEQKVRHEELRRKAGLETLPKPPKNAWFRIPNKYNDPLKSGLTADVTSPSTTLNLTLE